MGDYRRFGFILKIIVNLIALRYIFDSESKEIIKSSTIIVAVNLTNLVLDLGLATDQLSVTYGLRRLIRGLNHIFWIGLIIIVPLSLIFKLPLYLGVVVAISGIFRNYFIKRGNNWFLFNLDAISSLITLLLFIFIEIALLQCPYYLIVFSAAIIEFFILAPVCYKIMIFRHMRPAISLSNYFSKIIDISFWSIDILVVNLVFNPSIASSYFQLKEIYRKACQFFSVAVLRLYFDSLEIWIRSKYLLYLLYFSIFIGAIEYVILKSLFISIVILAFILTVVVNYLAVFKSLRIYNIHSILVFCSFLLILLVWRKNPDILLFISLFSLILIQLYDVRKVCN